MPQTDDTIAAIATPNGAGGIGVVRVSGPRVLDIADALIGKKPEPRIVHFSIFRDRDGYTIDRGLAIYFAAPKSFTGRTLPIAPLLYGRLSPVSTHEPCT